MSIPLIVKSKLFWTYKGRLDCCWYLGNMDGVTVARQDAYIADMDKFGIDTATLNICNEGQSTIFSGEFMASSFHEGKVNSFLNFTRRLKERGKNVVIVFFDFPQIPDSEHPKYPFWKYKDRIPAFLEIATKATAPIADGYILGIETNREPGPTIDEVEAGIGLIQQFAVRVVNGMEVKLPVGTHEQNVRRDSKDKLYMFRRVPRNADFVGYETMNNPTSGDGVSVVRMVEEINFLVANSGGKVVWVIESNSSENAIAIAQNCAMAKLPGVAGIGGPLN